MKKFFFPLLIVLPFCACTQKSGSKISYFVDNDTINIGEMKYLDTFQKTFFIKNTSDTNLKIAQLESACGCTSMLAKDSIIKSNDSLPIQIRYVPAYSNDSGNIMKYLTIRINSNPPFKNIIVKGKVKK